MKVRNSKETADNTFQQAATGNQIMENIIELLGNRLPEAAKQIESRLMKKYAITQFQIQISNLYNRYNLTCIDTVNDFVMSSDDNLTIAIKSLEMGLTSRSEIANSKRAKAKRLLAEANQPI